mmetsp:Transcript_19367/g.63149  ORF Transcript_19367/g.63149 Transcript_19367/m.63149 type:complete len:212 (+) Transcript_19367:410-1045(+)
MAAMRMRVGSASRLGSVCAAIADSRVELTSLSHPVSCERSSASEASIAPSPRSKVASNSSWRASSPTPVKESAWSSRITCRRCFFSSRRRMKSGSVPDKPMRVHPALRNGPGMPLSGALSTSTICALVAGGRYLASCAAAAGSDEARSTRSASAARSTASLPVFPVLAAASLSIRTARSSTALARSRRSVSYRFPRLVSDSNVDGRQFGKK